MILYKLFENIGTNVLNFHLIDDMVNINFEIITLI